MATPQPLAAIGSFHAHVYFDGPAQREAAMALRERIGERFRVRLGNVHDRQGLTVLVHPNTRDERRDHLLHALWMGEVLDIVGPERLGTDVEAEAPLAPDTAPTIAP